ncbi:MAG: hypothetical protein QOJ79_1432 [Actinomycetota bacterium]|jgi:predicted ATPase/class 3 adenylate cyclase|nr:hypothetical protein [Actinomycetota bacterium]
MGSLPAGDVVFAFVDVVGSTRAFQDDPDHYRAALRRVHAEVLGCAGRHDGVVVQTDGDGAFLAFGATDFAVAALVELQGLRSADDDPAALQLRAGAHRGHAVPVDGGYVALPVHVAARVAASAGAGQVIVSDAVAAAANDRASWHDFGERVLRDVAQPVRLWLAAGPRDEPRVPTPRRTNVAAAITSYVAGDALLAQLSDRMAAPGLVTLVGPGGLGKTRAATELALREVTRFAHGAWLVQLSALGPDEQVDRAVALALGVVAPDGDLRNAVLQHLRDQGPMLLVLDNCEHVLDSVAVFVAAALLGAPELRLLCTSRESIGLPEERVVRPTALATQSEAGQVSSAATLFRDRAASAGWVESEGDEAHIEEICVALDGLPLGIEIAASTAAVMPLSALAKSVQELGATARPLSRRGGDPRQRTLTELVGWSDQLLSTPERNALRILSALPGGFTVETAQAVLMHAADNAVDVAPDDVWGLTRRSLVDIDGPRLRMLHTIRSIAHGWLHEQPELVVAAQEALLAWAAAWCESTMSDAPADDLREQAMVELDNLLAALRVGVDLEIEQVGWVLARVAFIQMVSGLAGDLRAESVRILSWPARQTADSVRLRSTAVKVLNGLGVGSAAGLSPEGLIDIITAADATDDPVLQVQARLNVSTAFPLPAEADLARRLALEAREICQNHDIPRELAGLYANLGYIEHLDGRLQEALACYDEGIRLSRENGNADDAAINRLNKGEALLDLQRPAEALASIQEGLLHVTTQRTLRWIAMGLSGEAFLELGQPEEACAWLRDADAAESEILAKDPTLGYYADRFAAARERAGAESGEA